MKAPSFRLSKTEKGLLCEEAKKRGISVSTLISQLAMVSEEAKRSGEVRLSSESIHGILSCATEKDLAEAGRKLGEAFPQLYLSGTNRSCDYESCYFLLTKVLGDHNNWYDFNVEETPETTNFILFDDKKLGSKWLIFIAQYAAAVARTILNTNVKFQVAADHVLLEVPKPKKT